MIPRCRECYAILALDEESFCAAHKPAPKAPTYTVQRDSVTGWKHVDDYTSLADAIGSVANVAGALPFRVLCDGVFAWKGDGSDACDWVYEQRQAEQRAAEVSQ